MKWLHFVWRSATRSRRRSAMIILSLGATFFLYTTLRTALTAFEDQNTMNEARHRVFTQHAFSLLSTLPQSRLEPIRRIPDVEEVCGVTYFAGFYKDDSPENLFVQFAADTDTLFDVWPEIDISEEERQAYQEDGSGCLVHESLVQRFADDGWKLGHAVPLMGGLFPVDLKLTIRGIIHDPTFEDALLFHWSHFDAATGNQGLYTYFTTRCRSTGSMAGVIDRIDRESRNSEYPTSSMTEAAFNENFMQMLGDVRSFIRNLTLVLLIVMVLAAANAIALVTRERVREIALLKSLGFTSGRVRLLILQESCLIALCGGLLGSGVSWLVWSLFNAPGDFFVEFRVTPETLGLGVVFAVIVGLCAGVIPAFRAGAVSIVEGLRKVT